MIDGSVDADRTLELERAIEGDATVVAAVPATRLGRWSRTTRRFLGTSPLVVLAVALVAVVVLAAVFGELLAPYPPNDMSLTERLQAPSLSHLFGTDDYGRDIFSRVLAGARVSLVVAAVVLSVSIAVGTLLGAISGLAGGIVDEVIMRVTDLFLAFPALILAAAVAATLGGNLETTVLALATVYWPWYARLVRGQILALRERDFIMAARAVGTSPLRIIRVHLFPNVLPLIITQASLDVGYVILSTSALSFLGLGAQPPTAEWGAMMYDGRGYLRDAWWFPTFPGVALAVTVLAFNLLGDGLRDWLDPRLRHR